MVLNDILNKIKKYIAMDVNSGVLLLFFLTVFLFCIYIAYCSPVTTDDWIMFSVNCNTMSEMWNKALSYGNGRIFGNWGTMVIMRYHWLKVIYKAALMTIIIVLTPIIANSKRIATYILSFLMFIFISPRMFSNVYTLTSGFNNYVPPIAFTLIIMSLIKFCSEKNIFVMILASFLCFILSVCSQLYIEHSTIANSVLAGVFLLFHNQTMRKRFMNFLWFVGTLIGAAIMIFIPIIFAADDNIVSGYRSFSISIHTIYKHYGILAECLNSNSFMICIVCVLGLISIKFLKTKLKNSEYNVSKMTFICCLMFCVIKGYIMRYSVYDELYDTHISFAHIFFTLLILDVFYVIYKYICIKNSISKKMFFVFLYICILNGSLLFAEPLSIRCVYHSYTIIVYSVLILFEFIINKYNSDNVLKISEAVALIAFMTGFIMLANFNNISYWDNLRRSYLNKYMSEGVTEMMIFEIPSDYVYEPFYYGHRKYYYYDIGDIKFQYTTYMNYKKREPEQWEEIKEENLKDK